MGEADGRQGFHDTDPALLFCLWDLVKMVQSCSGCLLGLLFSFFWSVMSSLIFLTSLDHILW